MFVEPLALHLIDIFNDCFKTSENTVLIAGSGEPIYKPSNIEKSCHHIYFAHGYARSALHEIAHWCLAGAERRKQVDYGYWYAPDGRNAKQQAEFEKVEVKPQAIEWFLSQACGAKFRVSVDNLNGEETCAEPFMQAVCEQALYYQQQGLPTRAKLFYEALLNHFKTEAKLEFSIDQLRL